MTWADAGHPLAALLAGLGGLLVGWFVPLLVARIPEPDPEPDPGPGPSGRVLPEAPPKIPYADLAARPGLALRCSLATGVVAAVLAASVGGSGALLVLLPLVPIGVALAYVDWHTTLLPTRVIAPTYGLVMLCVLGAALIDGDRNAALHALAGWALLGGFFLVLWLIYPRGLGYGDVRLSGILGFALGYVGGAELAVGGYSAFLLGGVVGGVLGAVKRVNRKRFPFGPFMLVAAVLGVAIGPWVAQALGY